jgi:hypothetical protein
MPYTATTRADLRLLLQQRYESSPFWTDTDANLAINQTLRTWNLLTSYWRRRLTVANVPNDPLVPIPGTLAQQTACTWQGLPMTGVSVEELNLLTLDWWQARAGVGTAPARPLFWAPVGLNLIALYPASSVQGSLNVDGVRATPVLTADGDFVDIGPEELDTLTGYALHVCAMKAGASFLERTKPYLEQFIKAAVERNGLLKKTRWYTHFQKEGYAWSMIPDAPTTGQPADVPAGGGGL